MSHMYYWNGNDNKSRTCQFQCGVGVRQSRTVSTFQRHLYLHFVGGHIHDRGIPQIQLKLSSTQHKNLAASKQGCHVSKLMKLVENLAELNDSRDLKRGLWYTMYLPVFVYIAPNEVLVQCNPSFMTTVEPIFRGHC